MSDTVKMIDKNLGIFKKWGELIVSFMVIIFFATMIYFQINDNSKTIEQNKKEQVYKSSENRKEMSEKIKVLHNRMNTRYKREKEEDKTLEEKIRKLKENQIQLQIEQAYLRGYLKGKEGLNARPKSY